jgi:hypothetical protein
MEADISMLRETGHFYFALTSAAKSLCVGWKKRTMLAKLETSGSEPYIMRRRNL